MNGREIFYFIEYVCWIVAALIVAYPLFYTIVSLIRRDIRYPEARRQHRFAV